MDSRAKPVHARLFCAIDLPSSVLDALRADQSELRTALSRSAVAWSSIPQSHLTLLYIGNLEQSRISEISKALANVCRASSPFELSIVARGCFPSERQPRVAWRGVSDESGHLAKLAGHVLEALRRFVSQPGTRPFHPHLTIARVKHLARSERDGLVRWLHDAGMDAPPWRVTSVKLFASELHREGARHSALAEHRLGGE